MEKKRDVYYYAGTHWDREWYQPFQEFRSRLVDVLDDTIDRMQQNPDLKIFHLDGQTIVLEDYAEIVPEKAEALKALIAQDRIKVGPWYVMPDEFLLSGESLIRNLMMGHRLAKKWGAKEAWKFGYVCDIFGHIAQMPQIFQGFGIDYSLFCRGYGTGREPYFIWRAPDGSECLNFRLGETNGYGEFHNQVLDSGSPPGLYTGAEAKARAEKYIPFLAGLTKLPLHIVMNADDHQPLHQETLDYLKWIEEILPDARVHYCDLIEAGEKLKEFRDQLKVEEGEMNITNEKYTAFMITNTLSSYYPIKQANDQCQNRLEKVIEPMLVYASLAGHKLRRQYAALAYQYLIQNHPHDSICGCSIDQVHKDMEYRFDQVRELCDVLERQYLWQDQRTYQNGKDKETDGILTVYNPLPYERDGVVQATLLMKPDYPCQYAEPFGYENINSFWILDHEGNKIPYQIAELKRDQVSRVHNEFSQRCDEYTVAFRAKLPAGGKAEFRIVASQRPVRYLEHMTSGPDYMENEYLRVEIAPNGSIDILDKRTGKKYANQLNLADNSEIGDGWNHAAAVEDRIDYSYGKSARIEKVERGCARCTFRITKELELPAQMNFERSGLRRSQETVRCKAVFEVSLSQGAKEVQVALSFDNRAKDHQLRLLLPTGVEGDDYFAGQAFYCCQRKTGSKPETWDWKETDRFEKAMNGITGKRDADGAGLAFVSAEGLHEVVAYGVDDSLQITLLRAFRNTVGTNGETRCQINQELNYRFALVPLTGETAYSDLVKLQDVMGAGLFTGYREVEPDDALAAPQSFLKVEGKDVCVSVVKRAEDRDDAMVVRVYNASATATQATLTFDRPVTSAQAVNLNEEPTEGAAAVSGSQVTAPVAPWHICTLMVTL